MSNSSYNAALRKEAAAKGICTSCCSRRAKAKPSGGLFATCGVCQRRARAYKAAMK